jgi:N,N'-diacetylchitobiose transport system permease protein
VPTLVVLGGLLVYPLYRVAVLSLQEFGLRELVTGETTWVGLDNFREVLTDPLLWKVALPNTAVFAAVNVALTVVVGPARRGSAR